MTQAEAIPTVQRLRVTYARREALRYASHLELHMVWERTLRRARLPLAYSKGFNPNPRLHLASALPLGFLSRCELADIWLEWAPESSIPGPAGLAEQIQAAAPPGLEILAAEDVPLNLPALQTRVQSAEYQATPLEPLPSEMLLAAVEALLAADRLPRERRNKHYDLRPLIEQLEVRQDGLFMRLAAREGATGRPEEVLDALGLDATAFRVERLKLMLID